MGRLIIWPGFDILKLVTVEQNESLIICRVYSLFQAFADFILYVAQIQTTNNEIAVLKKRPTKC